MQWFRRVRFIIITFSLVLYLPMGIAESLGSFGNAIFLFQEKMAKKGDVRAQYKLGTLYEFGVSVQQNMEEARNWYQLAAQSDFQPAINRNIYLDIKANGFEAQKHNPWLATLKQQADKQEPNALILLGQMYHHGIGESVDLNKALELLSRASALGSTEVDSEIDRITLEISQQNAALQQQKAASQQQKSVDDRRSKKQKADETAEKRQRYDEVMRQIREEKIILDQQQEWVEDQRKLKE